MKTRLPPVTDAPATAWDNPLTGRAAPLHMYTTLPQRLTAMLQRGRVGIYGAAATLAALIPMRMAHAQQAGSAVLDGDAMLLRTVLALMFVIAMILGAAWLARRLGLIGRSSGELPMRVVASCAIGTRERVVVLEVEETWLVLGVTAHNITPLHTLPANTQPTPPSAVASASISPAARALEKLWRRNPPPAAPGTGSG